jgi:small ligand-binding sensory domain FIST
METTVGRMKCAVAGVNAAGRRDIAGDLSERLRDELDPESADLCAVFATPHFEDELGRIAAEIHEALSPRAFIGVSGEGVICGETEYESQPALALFAAHLPDVRLASFHLSKEDLDRTSTPAELAENIAVAPDQSPHFIVLGDPFTFPILDFLGRLGAAYPGRPAIGGMASAAEQPGQNVLIFEGHTQRSGLVGVALWGNVRLDTVVSQGCRPIGRHMVITKAERNIIHQLGGRPPLKVISQMLEELQAGAPRDMELLRERGLLVGRVINEHQGRFARGDFLIRNPMGFDPDSGAMAVNDFVRTGQTIQFHVRDGRTATEDLEALLTPAGKEPAAGALLFSCNGRGSRLFTGRHHDARAVFDHCGGPPIAGFFCAGEIGPVGERNFLHGHTASIGLLRPGRTP